jgi:DNA adenine methylase
MNHHTAILPYYGGKRLLAGTILRQLGPHKAYWEPFCGSLAVLLAKPASPHEHVNDLHGDLVNLARVLRVEDLAVALYSRLARTLCCEAIFDEARLWWLERDHLPADAPPDPERAYRYFVVSWMGRNGISGTERYNHSYSVCWKNQGGNRATRFASAVESIPWWHQRLRRVVILRRDGISLLEKVEDLKGVAIYADPPYLVSSRAKTGSGGVYQHDFTLADHQRLATALARFQRARVVLSGYDHPELLALYPGWSCLRVTASRLLLSVGTRNCRAPAKECPEVLLVNGQLAQTTATLFETR